MKTGPLAEALAWTAWLAGKEGDQASRGVVAAFSHVLAALTPGHSESARRLAHVCCCDGPSLSRAFINIERCSAAGASLDSYYTVHIRR